MPAKDIYHDTVRIALEKDGWKITDDPYFIRAIDVAFHIDLGAEKIFAAEKGPEKIVVEVKSFLGQSFVTEFHIAMGQFDNYLIALEDKEPERILFLAVPSLAFDAYFQKQFIQKVVKRKAIKFIVFDEVKEEIRQWIK
jgi:hypothetical protein